MCFLFKATDISHDKMPISSNSVAVVEKSVDTVSCSFRNNRNTNRMIAYQCEKSSHGANTQIILLQTMPCGMSALQVHYTCEFVRDYTKQPCMDG